MPKKSKKTIPNLALKAARVKAGLTQEALAKKLGIGVTTYVEKENGKRSFDIIEAGMIASILNESPTALFFAS